MTDPLGIGRFQKSNLTDGFVIEHIGRNFYKIYIKDDPDHIILSGGDDTKNITIPMLFRITHLEMHSDDATSKAIELFILHPNYNNLGSPTHLYNETDTKLDIFRTYGEGVEFEGGSTIQLVVNGTGTKLYNLLIYIQVLK